MRIFVPLPRFVFFLTLSVASTAQAFDAGVPCRIVNRAQAAYGAPGFTWRVGPSSDPVSATSPSPSPSPSPFSMAVWGDSLTSAVHFLDGVLQGYGIERKDVLPAFIQAGLQVRGLALPLKDYCASTGWTTRYAYKEKPGTRAFSKGLLSMHSATPGAMVFLDFRAPRPGHRLNQLTILYEKREPDASLLLAVSIDGAPEQMISLSRTDAKALHLTPDGPMSTLRIRLVSGAVTLHGFEPGHQGMPAAVVDGLSIPGATLRGWSNTDDRLINAGERRGMPARAPDYDLILIQSGTNEGAGRFDRTAYLADVRASLTRIRTFYPRSRCVLIGPPDRGVVGATGPPASLRYAVIHREIALAQRQVASEHDCGFWDWQAAMGGPGAAKRWAGMTPPQMQSDLTHLTAKGYVASGRMFAEEFPLKNKK